MHNQVYTFGDKTTRVCSMCAFCRLPRAKTDIRRGEIMTGRMVDNSLIICWLAILAIFPLTCNGASDAILDSCSGDQIEFTIVADTAQQDDGSSWYINYKNADDSQTLSCDGASTGLSYTEVENNGVFTYNVTISGITEGTCGKYNETADTYTLEVVIPYLSFLVTESDVTIQLQCSLTEVYKTNVAPSQPASTLAPDASRAQDVEEPIVNGYIYENLIDQAPTDLSIGTMIRIYVEITDGKNGYWTDIIIDTLTAEDDNAATTATVDLITTRACVNANYTSKLSTTYSPDKGLNDFANFTAFKFKDASDIVVFTASVIVCAKDYGGDQCSQSCSARKRRALDYNIYANDDMSYPEDQMEYESDDAERPSSFHKVLRLAMLVTDPSEVKQRQTPSVCTWDNARPANNDIHEVALHDNWCMSRGTGVAVLVCVLVITLFVVSVSAVCICVRQRKRKIVRERLVSEGSVPSLPSCRKSVSSYPEDIVYHCNGRSSLVESDYLQAVHGSGGRVIAVVDDTVSPGSLSTIAEEESKLSM